jgi:hypothetical protein
MLVFGLFGVLRVMPKTVADLLTCWKGNFGRRHTNEIWKAVPLCIMCCIRRERNVWNL